MTHPINISIIINKNIVEYDVRQRVRQILFHKNESVNSFCLKTTDNKKGEVIPLKVHQ